MTPQEAKQEARQNRDKEIADVEKALNKQIVERLKRDPDARSMRLSQYGTRCSEWSWEAAIWQLRARGWVIKAVKRSWWDRLFDKSFEYWVIFEKSTANESPYR